LRDLSINMNSVIAKMPYDTYRPGLSEGKQCHAAGQLLSGALLSAQRGLRITPAPHSPARNSGRAPVDPHALTLVPIRPDDRGSQPHGAISKAEMGYRIFSPPRDNAYVKGELCLEFCNWARGAVRTIQSEHVMSGIYYCRLTTAACETTRTFTLAR
jgi:hypothetical protein